MTDISPHGLHHVTAIAGHPQRNVDFYTDVLGLRLVKQTVNFDDPDTYHLYYGDESGQPSTLLTFFPWPRVARGQHGAGVVYSTAFSIPPGSLGWWQRRLADHEIETTAPVHRDTEEVVSFRDPEGLLIDLVDSEGDTRSGWDGAASVPAEHAIRGLHTVTMAEASPNRTAGMLLNVLGMTLDSDEGGRARFSMAHGDSGAMVDLVPGPSTPGVQGSGTVHHFALRAPDEEAQARWRDQLVETGARVTEILDRYYFTSIYFREPGGILLEIATERPGFTVDEPLLELGRRLKLPPWLEPRREHIEQALPPLNVPPRGPRPRQ